MSGRLRLFAACAVLVALAGRAGASSQAVHPLDWFPVARARSRLLPGAQGVLSTNVSGTVPSSGTWVSVSWDLAGTGFAPSSSDVVALYVPATADLQLTAPVKFKNATGALNGTLRCGRGDWRSRGQRAGRSEGRRLPSGLHRACAV
jgi:hypothetical protein